MSIIDPNSRSEYAEPTPEQALKTAKALERLQELLAQQLKGQTPTTDRVIACVQETIAAARNRTRTNKEQYLKLRRMNYGHSRN